jgi:hypothetical protein
MAVVLNFTTAGTFVFLINSSSCYISCCSCTRFATILHDCATPLAVQPTAACNRRKHAFMPAPNQGITHAKCALHHGIVTMPYHCTMSPAGLHSAAAAAMDSGRYPRRGRSASAAAAAAAPAAGQQKKQQQQQQQSKKQQEEEEDAALPADEEELGEDAEGSDDDGSGSSEEEEGDAASDEEAAAGSHAADGEAAGSGEGEQEDDEADGEQEEEEADASGEDEDEEEAAAALDDGAEADDEEEAEEEEEAEGDDAEGDEDEEGATPAPSSSQQQQQQPPPPHRAGAAAGKAAGGRPPKGKPGRPPGTAAKAVTAQRAVHVYRDYSYVLDLPKEEQQMILANAEKVRKARGAARAAPFPEPKRNKCHWDHLLEEAEWMAKEFQRCARSSSSCCMDSCGCGCIMVAWGGPVTCSNGA